MFPEGGITHARGRHAEDVSEGGASEGDSKGGVARFIRLVAHPCVWAKGKGQTPAANLEGLKRGFKALKEALRLYCYWIFGVQDLLNQHL